MDAAIEPGAYAAERHAEIGVNWVTILGLATGWAGNTPGVDFDEAGDPAHQRADREVQRLAVILRELIAEGALPALP